MRWLEVRVYPVIRLHQRFLSIVVKAVYSGIVDTLTSVILAFAETISQCYVGLPAQIFEAILLHIHAHNIVKLVRKPVARRCAEYRINSYCLIGAGGC